MIDLSDVSADGIQRKMHCDENYIYSTVKSVTAIKYKGPVYDFSVQNKASYISAGCGVSNSPAGYIGHRETTPQLTQERLDKYHTDKAKLTFVLFDEIEKANDALWNLLLGILDHASLTLGDNRVVNFSKSVIVMTSNLGATEIEKIMDGSIGFVTSHPEDSDVHAKTTNAALSAVRRKFSPEFLNRIDDMVVFHRLTHDDLMKILALEMRAVQERILVAKCPPFILLWTPAAASLLIEEGTSKQYGARKLKRVIEHLVVKPLSKLLLSHQIDSADTVTVDARDGTIVFLHQYR